MKKNLLILLGLFLISLPLIYPFLPAGFLATDDGEWAVVRLAEMHREVRDGQLPARWAGYLNHGYGYPLFLFTYPLPYYMAEAFHLGGLGLVDAVKALFIVSILGSAVAMYLFARQHWGGAGAVGATILYLYAPYRLTNLYVRGSLGESLALVFFPVLFFLFEKLVRNGSFKLVSVTAVTLAAFILTHNATVVLFAPILGGWIFYLLVNSSRRRAALGQVAVAIASGLGLSASFWLPALAEKKYIALSLVPLADRSDYFLSVGNFLLPNKTSAINTPITFGAVHFFGLVLSGIGVVLLPKKFRTQKPLLFLLTAATLVVLVMVFPFSEIFWQLPLLAEIDFPWRILAVAAFLTAFTVAGLSLTNIGKILLLILSGMAVVSVMSSPPAIVRIDKGDAYYATNDATTTSADELMPVWVTQKPTNRPPARAILTPDSPVTVLSESSHRLVLESLSPVPAELVVNILYFPGWRAEVDGREVALAKTERTGVMKIALAAGRHVTEFSFEKTGVRLAADILSGGSFLLLALWILSKKIFRYF